MALLSTIFLSKRFDILLRPLPLLGDEPSLERETTRLLWDKLYPDVTSLLVAALEKNHTALARIVQIYGLYATAKLFGACIWRDFPKYKQFIHPVRRAELEYLWLYRQSQTKQEPPRAAIAPILREIRRLK